jgi:hypothetical protein
MTLKKSRKQKARTDPVEVNCRIRPLPEDEGESCLKILDEQNLMLEIPEVSHIFLKIISQFVSITFVYLLSVRHHIVLAK